MKHFYAMLFLWLSLGGQQTQAQNDSLPKINSQSLRGQVFDYQSKQPIEGVVLELMNINPGRSTLSDAQGQFALEAVPLGRQRIRASKEGYQEIIVTDIVLSLGKEALVEVPMSELVVEKVKNSEITTFKTPRNQPRFAQNNQWQPNNPFSLMSTLSFTREEVLRYAGGFGDPARLLTNHGSTFNTDDSQNYMTVRGNSPLGNAWLVDGVPILNPNHFATLGNTGAVFPIINNNALDRSDFITGNFSAEYGNLFAACTDMQLRRGNDRRYEFAAQMSLFGLEALAEGPIKKGKSSFMLSYRYSFLGLIQRLGIQLTTNAAPNYQDLNFKFHWQHARLGQFSFSGIMGGSNVALLNDNINPNDPFAERGRDLYLRDRQGLWILQNRYAFKRRGRQSYLQTTVSLWMQKYHSYRDSIDAQGEKHPFYEANERFIRPGLSTVLNNKFSPRFTLRSGLRLYGYWFNINDRRLDLGIPDFNLQTQAVHVEAFSQAQWHLSSRFWLQAGVFGQYYSLNKKSWAVEPRLHLHYRINHQHFLTLGYGLYSRINDFSTASVVSQLSDGSLNRSNQALGLIRSQHLGFSHRWLLHKDWSLKSELYGQYLFDIPVEQSASAFSLINYGDFSLLPALSDLKNEGCAYNYGLETSLQRSFSKGFYLALSLGLFDSQYQGSDGQWRKTAFNTRYVTQVVAGREFRLGRRSVWMLDLRYKHYGRRPFVPVDLAASQQAGQEVRDWSRAYTVYLPGYHRLDFKAGIRINAGRKTAHQISLDFVNVLGLSNVLQERYNPISREVVTQYQFGFLPNLFYQFLF